MGGEGSSGVTPGVTGKQGRAEGERADGASYGSASPAEKVAESQRAFTPWISGCGTRLAYPVSVWYIVLYELYLIIKTIQFLSKH